VNRYAEWSRYLTRCKTLWLFADIPYAGILVRADIAVRGCRYGFRIVIDDVGLVLLDEIEKLPHPDASSLIFFVPTLAFKFLRIP
jgi:hypothetical protein